MEFGLFHFSYIKCIHFANLLINSELFHYNFLHWCYAYTYWLRLTLHSAYVFQYLCRHPYWRCLLFPRWRLSALLVFLSTVFSKFSVFCSSDKSGPLCLCLCWSYYQNSLFFCSSDKNGSLCLCLCRPYYQNSLYFVSVPKAICCTCIYINGD